MNAAIKGKMNECFKERCSHHWFHVLLIHLKSWFLQKMEVELTTEALFFPSCISTNDHYLVRWNCPRIHKKSIKCKKLFINNTLLFTIFKIIPFSTLTQNFLIVVIFVRIDRRWMFIITEIIICIIVIATLRLISEIIFQWIDKSYSDS